MPQNEIDSLSIVISADTSKATKNVQELIKKLGALRNTFKSLNTMSGGIKPLVKGLQDIAKIDFSGAEKSLEALAKIIDKIDKNKIKELAESQKLMGERATAVALSQSQEDVGAFGIKKSFSLQDYSGGLPIVKVSKELSDAYKQQAREARMALDPLVQLNEKMAELGFDINQIKAVGNAFQNLKPEYTREQLDELKKTLEELGLSSQKVQAVMKKSGALGDDKKSGGFGGFMKRVAGRMVFSLVRLIVQVVKDLIKQLVSDFAKIDDNFNGIISEAWSAIKYLKGAIKASLAPVVQLLAPLITMISNVFGDLLNKVAEFTAMLSGQDYYYKAKTSVEDFRDSIDSANKSLTLGIDELNTINTQDNSNEYEKVAISENTKSLKYIVKVLQSLEPIITAIEQSLHLFPLQAIFEVLKIIEPVIILISTLLQTIFDFLGRVLLSIPAIIKGLFTGEWNSLKEVWNGFDEKISGIWKESLPELIESAQDALQTLEDIKNFIRGGILGANGVNTSSGNSGWDKTWKLLLGGLTGGVSLLLTGTGFASGGFPEDGLFMANHNELVGQFSNGKTAVANNQQITEGIYRAVLQAMNDSNGGKGKGVVVYLDSREIASRVEERQQQQGVISFKEGYKYGG